MQNRRAYQTYLIKNNKNASSSITDLNILWLIKTKYDINNTNNNNKEITPRQVQFQNPIMKSEVVSQN